MSETAAYDDARRVLHLVRELHLHGYEQLRIAPGMSPSGLHWRCAITPASNIRPDHGARIGEFHNSLVAHYTSPNRKHYFGWDDARECDAAALAGLFLQRLPAIAEAGRGPDPTYVNWYAEMLRLTEPDAFPIAYADWPLPSDHIKTVGKRSIRIPLPPPRPSMEVLQDE